MSSPPRRMKTNRNISNEVSDGQQRSVSFQRPRLLKDCRYCNKDHPLRKCLRFKRLSAWDRLKVVRKYKYCINCLAHSHLLKDCRCRDRCKECLAKHHTLLHMPSSDQTKRRQRRQHPRKQQPTDRLRNQLQPSRGSDNCYNVNPSMGTNSSSFPTIVINVTPK